MGTGMVGSSTVASGAVRQEAQLHMLVRGLELVHLPTKQKILWSPRSETEEGGMNASDRLFESTIGKVDMEDEHAPSELNVTSRFYRYKSSCSKSSVSKLLS
jgi:hypothetical protein